MNPLPTPYDIVEIDYFPAAPPLWFWMVLILAAVCIYLAIKYIRHKLSNPKPELNDLESLSKRLKELSADKTTDAERASSEASILVRGFLSYRYDYPFDSFSSTELKKFSSQTEDKNLKKIISEVSELEILRYQPSIDFRKKFQQKLHSIYDCLLLLDQTDQRSLKNV